MPILSYESLEAVPEGLKDDAKEDGDKFTVNVTPMSKLEEFRNNNNTLLKKENDYKAALEGFGEIVGDDIEAFKAELSEMKALKQQHEDGKFKGNDAVQAEVTKRVTAVNEDHKAQLAEFGKKLQEAERRGDAAEKSLDDSKIDRAITEAVMHKESGMRSEAIQDIMTRARDVWSVDKDTGKLIATNGETTLYGADGVTLMTPLEWMAKVRETAPHLAIPSEGGGAAGGSDTNLGGMSSDDFQKQDPTERIRIARKAGL